MGILNLGLLGLLMVAASTVAVWTQLSTGVRSPGSLAGGQAVYCKQRDSMLVFGGYRNVQSGLQYVVQFSADLWEYKFASGEWSPLTMINAPAGRVYATFTGLDANSSISDNCRALLHGGITRYGLSVTNVYLGDTLIMDLTSKTATFTKVDSVISPSILYGAAAVSRRGSVIQFGGTDGNTSFNDVYLFTTNETTGQWTVIPRSGSYVPSPRYSHSMALNLGSTPADDQLLVFGGLKKPGVVLSDLLVFSFETGMWKLASGLKVERYLHISAAFAGRLYVFGGQTVQGTDGFVFDTILVTTLNPALNSQVPNVNLDSPQCVANDNKFGLWCVSSVDDDPKTPTKRGETIGVVRNDQLIIYGGKVPQRLEFSDMWALNLSQAAQSLKVAEADQLGTSDLASTMYFMIAILSMMVVCFIVFVISLRRQRSSNPIFQTVVVNRPRVVGARQSVVEALPLKTYRKKEADERRASRRLSRRTSASGTVSPSPSAEGLDSSTSAALVVANPALDRIDQDDLHDLCAICLTDYEDGEQLRVLPCDHFFHPACVDQWLRTHNACPMCKAAVDSDPERNEDAAAGSQVLVSPQSSENPAFEADPEDRVPASDGTRQGDTRDVSNASQILRDETSRNNIVIDLTEGRPLSTSVRAPTASMSDAQARVQTDDDRVVIDLSAPENHPPNRNVPPSADV